MGKLIGASDALINVIASENTWIESSAVEQLKSTARWKGIVKAVGLPDLHPGKFNPIGAAFISKKMIYPQLVGNDIGCGMGLWQSDLLVRKLKRDKWVKQLEGLESAWPGDIEQWLAAANLPSSSFEHVLGTIGAGNHFAELQRVIKIIDEEACAQLGIDAQYLQLLVHSGSRGLGESILRDFLDGDEVEKGLQEGADDALQYLAQHDQACAWAESNRALIAKRFFDCLHASGQCLLDVNHNTVTPIKFNDAWHWLHRKGATPSTSGMVVIPGSRGALSYLVKPIGGQVENAFSLAHGAGRKWQRSSVKSRLARFKADDFTQTSFGSRVICEDKKLIFEEAPQAYKDIDVVINDMGERGLIKVIALLQPVITYKTRRVT